MERVLLVVLVVGSCVVFTAKGEPVQYGKPNMVGLSSKEEDLYYYDYDYDYDDTEQVDFLSNYQYYYYDYEYDYEDEEKDHTISIPQKQTLDNLSLFGNDNQYQYLDYYNYDYNEKDDYYDYDYEDENNDYTISNSQILNNQQLFSNDDYYQYLDYYNYDYDDEEVTQIWTIDVFYTYNDYYYDYNYDYEDEFETTKNTQQESIVDRIREQLLSALKQVDEQEEKEMQLVIDEANDQNKYFQINQNTIWGVILAMTLISFASIMLCTCKQDKRTTKIEAKVDKKEKEEQPKRKEQFDKEQSQEQEREQLVPRRTTNLPA
eukprot:TRINITY_DN8451_c0_g1_i8.p1 TRINITY_DN8451_c0_g1~~TRINITY_DN8451_c0_g1_i8.p1  ORF type:complete len:319 (-),score=44.49 TRINITY_DN8451_c0_g1_i8:244-1200(-)